MTNLNDARVPVPINPENEKKRFTFSRRDFLKASGVSLGALGLVGCGGTPTTPTNEGSGSGSGSGSANNGGSTLRVGMEVAYAPYNWQTDTETEFTIPIDGIANAFADGYDVQIAKVVAEGMGREAVAVKLDWDGLIDACMKGTIDVIIAGMTSTPERAQSIDFSEPYLTETYGLLVKGESEYAGATTLADFTGAAVVGQKDTIFDEIIEDIPGVNHLAPVDSEPAAIAAVVNGTADACTFPENNRDGFLRANPSLVAIDFAAGDGFTEENPCNIGLAKGQEDVVAQINEILAGVSEDERNAMWEAACERQPA